MIASKNLFLSDITVADLDCSAVYPGRKLRYAAKCTVSELVVPESFAATLSGLLQDTLPKYSPCVNILKPPFPVRYRYSMVQTLRKVREKLEADASILASRSKSDSSFRISNAAKKSIIKKKGLSTARTGNNPSSSTVSFPISHGQFLESDIAISASEALSHAMSGMMVSMLKSLLLFTRDGQDERLMKATKENDRKPSTVQDSAVYQDEIRFILIGNIKFDLDGFLSFTKDDVRFFLRYLLKTKAFKV